MASSSSQTSAPVVYFAEFGADLRSRELRRGGSKLRLPDQSFQVLAILLERPGELISREEFQKRLWPSDTFVDFDHGLNNAVNRLRESLGDSAEAPRFIETLPRRGYRFIGAVETPRTEASDSGASAGPPRKIKRRWLWAASTASAAGLLFTIAASRLVQNPLQSGLSSIEVHPLLALHGSQSAPAFSPDGNQIAFGEYEGKDGAIYTTLIGGDKPLRLTMKSDVCCPTWSPDNRRIAFMRFLKGGFSINLVSALGGSEKTLYTAESSTVRGFARLDWSPDGKSLAFAGPASRWGSSRITLLSLDDMTVRTLTSPSEQEYDGEPAFSPDGSRLAFVRGSIGGLANDLFLISVAGGEPRRLTFDNTWGGSPTWTQDGADIVFSSTRGGPLNLWRISANGGPPQPVAGVSAIAYRPTIPHKGNLLAYEHANINGSIWEIRLKERTHSLGPPTRVIAAKGLINGRPSFSPDGKKVVFESDRLGYSDIWYCDRNGSNCTQLTSLHGTAGTARWSPDGQRIAFEFQSQHYYDVYVVEVSSGRSRRLPTFSQADNGAPNWSRDGKWIYFYSSHEKGPLQLWKTPLQGGAPVRVTMNGGVYAIESDDGRSLFYSKFEQPGVWKMPLNGGDEERILDQPPGYQWSNWAVSPNGLYFVDGINSEKARIEFFDFGTHKRTVIGDVDKPTPGLALAPDGKSLLYSRNESEEYEIMLVKNFH